MAKKKIVIFICACIVYGVNPCFAQGPQRLAGKYKDYNLVLVILDALRPDHLGCYGYPKGTSRNIDRLASKGAVFENAFCQAPWTLPSITSIFTSLHPFSHRVKNVLKDELGPRIYTLAQILSLYGYSTAWFGGRDDPHSGRAKGVLKGYSLKRNLGALAEGSSDKALEYYIHDRLKRPFFITVHSYSVHAQSHPLARFNNQFSGKISQEFKDAFDSLDEKNFEGMQYLYNREPERLYEIMSKEDVDKHKDYFSGEYSQEKFRSLQQLIWGLPISNRVLFSQLRSKKFHAIMVSFSKEKKTDILLSLDSSLYTTDAYLVGGLWDTLKNAGVDERTIIVITADHGDEYYEHGHYGHGGHLYEESVHVPLIIYIPGMSKPLRVHELVQSIDILPTVLELLAIPIPAQAQGISLLGILEQRRGAVRHEVIFCQTPGDTFAIRSNKWKLIEKEPLASAIKDSDELYNLRDDPKEQHNLIHPRQKVAEALKKQLDEWRESLIVYQTEEFEFMPGINEETRERIRKTGYW